MLISLLFCLEGIGFENCIGIEIGWKFEVVKDNRFVLKRIDECSDFLVYRFTFIVFLGYFLYI